MSNGEVVANRFRSLVTHSVYPDSTDTPSSGDGLVQMTYNLDGSLETRIDQRAKLVRFYSNAETLTDRLNREAYEKV